MITVHEICPATFPGVILGLLEGIDAGREQITLVGIEATHAVYRTGGLWLLKVFYDCGEWDYVDYWAGPKCKGWHGHPDDGSAAERAAWQPVLMWTPERREPWRMKRVRRELGYG